MVEQRRLPEGPRGRRVGKPDTKQQILSVALDQFAEVGFPATTIRSVASAAQVDPSLVAHFFVNKDGLFSAAVGDILDELRPRVAAALASDAPDLGTRLATAYLGFWEAPASGLRLSAVYRSANSSPRAAEMVGSLLAGVSGQAMLEPLPVDVRERFPLVMAQLMGLAVARYVARVQSLAEPSLGDLVRAVGPGLDHTLRGGAGSSESS